VTVLSEREPQSVTVTPHADGARPPLGSGGPSRSENTAPTAAAVRATLYLPTQWGHEERGDGYSPVRDPDARTERRA
jgi:hypothetical protein